MRAVAYIRVSDSSQVDGHSLDAQERLFHELCKSREWMPGITYREEGRSAHSDSPLNGLGLVSRPLPLGAGPPVARYGATRASGGPVWTVPTEEPLDRSIGPGPLPAVPAIPGITLNSGT